MFWEQNDLATTLVLLIPYVLDFVWKWQDLGMCHIYGIKETTSVNKTSIKHLVLRRNNCIVKTLYVVFIIVR